MIFNNIDSKAKGFTLIELLVVVAIVSLLSSVVLVSLNSARVKVRDVRRMADLGQIRAALEMYYNDYGYYPQSGCGWDCNGYKVSYDSSWDSLASDLSLYIRSLPKDPLNSGGCPPWSNGCYTYTYGNVGRTTYRGQYDLTAQFEDSSNPYRCGVRGYRFYFDDILSWCTSYSNQIYEASTN